MGSAHPTRYAHHIFVQDWLTPIPELIAATDEASILKTELCDRIPIRDWGFSNITLLGDAAHPTLPTIGQGACMALEDALVLTKCLLEQSHPAMPLALHFVQNAFRQYESLRFARTKMIVEESLNSKQMLLIENSITMALRNTLLKLLPNQLFENKMKAIHAYRA
ncbi:MAG: FAD-dependent monooxygenase [Heteroscytonema crispum UTEX LB 1556]